MRTDANSIIVVRKMRIKRFNEQEMCAIRSDSGGNACERMPPTVPPAYVTARGSCRIRFLNEHGAREREIKEIKHLEGDHSAPESEAERQKSTWPSKYSRIRRCPSQFANPFLPAQKLNCEVINL